MSIVLINNLYLVPLRRRITLMIRGLHIILLALIANVSLFAQPSQIILDQQDGRVTFAVDEVTPPESLLGHHISGYNLAMGITRDYSVSFISDWQPEIIANSFADVDNLCDIGEDVVFQMLLTAWCQHRPVVLSPDVIWLIICQQFSYQVNLHPERFRQRLVEHEGKKDLVIETDTPISEISDWESVIFSFVTEISNNTKNDIATTLIADFSTTGTDERIASAVTLMDVVKQYFDYIMIYGVCGIPSITLTGTPEDWQIVLMKTKELGKIGMRWWTSGLEPILEEFVKAAEGNPDYWFWKDIVKKSRPRKIQGPTCSRRPVRQTKFDGWFLKFFPYDNNGRTPKKVTITQTMLPETVSVPLKYQVVTSNGVLLSEIPMELVAGVVGVLEDPETYTMTPKIGWFLRSARSLEDIEKDQQQLDSLFRL